MLDLVGIGALNVDFIATRQMMQARSPDLVPELARRFEYGTERYLDATEVEKTIAQMGGAASLKVFLGGSAFNTIHAAARVGTGLKLGFVGVAGTSPDARNSFLDELKALSVDTTFVKREKTQPAGKCVSYIRDGERSLLTTPGANTRLAPYIKSKRLALLEFLANSKIVHLTSLFDEDSPPLILKLLQEAKKRNPWLRLSFDPGHEWVKARAKWLGPLLRISNYVFLNNREFIELGRLTEVASDIEVASSILANCDVSGVLIVVKRYDSILLFQKLQAKTICREISNQILLDDEIEDATGAGDVFAAGFLIGTLIPGLELSHAVDIGLQLARAKLTTAGTSGFGLFPSLFQKATKSVFLADSPILELAPQSRPQPLPKQASADSRRVFVVHGHDDGAKEAVAHYLSKLELNPIVLHEQPNRGRTIIEKFEAHADVAFAVVLFTPDDFGYPAGKSDEAKPRARQNVVLELGFFMAALGRDRVCVLYKSGVEVPSDYSGVLYHAMDDGGAWRFSLAREMQAAGLKVDLNKAL